MTRDMNLNLLVCRHIILVLMNEFKVFCIFVLGPSIRIFRGRQIKFQLLTAIGLNTLGSIYILEHLPEKEKKKIISKNIGG